MVRRRLVSFSSFSKTQRTPRSITNLAVTHEPPAAPCSTQCPIFPKPLWFSTFVFLKEIPRAKFGQGITKRYTCPWDLNTWHCLDGWMGYLKPMGGSSASQVGCSHPPPKSLLYLWASTATFSLFWGDGACPEEPPHASEFMVQVCCWSLSGLGHFHGAWLR